MRAGRLAALGLCLALVGPVGLFPPRGRAAAGEEEVTIYRDEFGVPNIFADTAEGKQFSPQPPDIARKAARARRASDVRSGYALSKSVRSRNGNP